MAMSPSTTIATAGLLVIKENQLLLAYSKKKNAWYLPGGKIDPDETAEQAIVRETKEELSIDLLPEQLQYYCHLSAPAYGEQGNTIMEQDCFLYNLTEKVVPNNEIGAVQFFSLDAYLKEPAQVIGVLKIFTILEEDGRFLFK